MVEPENGGPFRRDFEVGNHHMQGSNVLGGDIYVCSYP